MCKVKINVCKSECSDNFSKIGISHKQKGYNIDVIKQSASLALNPVTVDHFAYLFNFTPVGRGSDFMMARLKKYSLDDLGRNFLCLLLGLPGFKWWFSFAPVFQW